jgi:hypothetical protein
MVWNPEHRDCALARSICRNQSRNGVSVRKALSAAESGLRQSNQKHLASTPIARRDLGHSPNGRPCVNHHDICWQRS